MADTRNLADADPKLAAAVRAIQVEFQSDQPDYELRVTGVLRSDADQLKAFLSGASQIDPRQPAQRKRARHLAQGSSKKSNAVDCLIVFRPTGQSIDALMLAGKMNRSHWTALWRVFGLLAQAHGLRHGNDWNGNRIPVGPDPDESFVDVYHVEIPL